MLHRGSHLMYLLQFESFQNSIRMFLYKFSEIRLTVLAYAVGVIIALILILRVLARKK